MNIKKATLFAVAILLATSGIFICFFPSPYEAKLDSVAVNDIAQSLAENWKSLKETELPGKQYSLDFVVTDNNGKLIRATRRGLNENISSAIKNRDTIIDIQQNSILLGKLIIYNNTAELWKEYRHNLIYFFIVITVLMAMICLLYAFYTDRYIFRPFRKLQAFARHVAEGKLDFPLEMDKNNLFGAFSESFDLMRAELAKARENERIANQSKKELVASLSHDIKTPVASIKAVSEIMFVKSHDEEAKRQLEVINSKADQINALITNMFNATLEELQELKVAVTEESSTVLHEMIKNTDYNNCVSISPLPECIVLADKLRLLQVIDNIINNSYKYAGTSISVTAAIEGQYLEIQFKDYGPGVSQDEIPLLFNKFYRAGNSKGKSGTGLGLYISRYLMKKMSGDIACKNTEDGFAVIIKLLIA